MGTYTLVVTTPDGVSQDDLIESIGVDGHGDLSGVEVVFCGPGSLVQDVAEDGEAERPDDETACAGCGVPMFVATSQVGSAVCESCAAEQRQLVALEVTSEGMPTHRVRAVHGERVLIEMVMPDGSTRTVEASHQRDGDGDSFVNLRGVDCKLTGELPGMYYPEPIA